MNRWLRILKHRWLDDADVRRAMPAQALARIGALVAQSERQHSGEIRVVIEAGLPWSYLWKRLRARDRAVMLFGKLRVWDTAQNNGVLIYLLLAERAVEIVADRGLNPHADADFWRQVIEGMRPDLQAARFEAGLTRAITSVDERLQTAFARQARDRDENELPDAPLVL
jgi:uncharacterized membrane protein